LVYSALLAAVAGCNDWGNAGDPPLLFTRLGGRVVDGETQVPLSGVVVKICNYEVSSSTDGDGHWVIEIIPGLQDTHIRITFERSGYGSVGIDGDLDPGDTTFGGTENRHFVDVGTTFMRPGAPATVHVTLDGSPWAGAAVYALPQEFAYDGTGEDDCTDLNIVTTTNASGVATLANLDPKQYYEVVVTMQDTDGDNVPNTTSESTSVNLSQWGSVYAINAQTMTPSVSPEVTGTNLAEFDDSFFMPTGPIDSTVDHFLTPFSNTYGNPDLNDERFNLPDEDIGSFREAVVTSNGSVQVVFWTPVNVFEPNFRWRNNLVSPADPMFNDDLDIAATGTALAGSDFTIYNFVPTSPLPSNEYVTLNFIARSRVDEAQSNNIDISFYVPLRLSTIPVTLDNFNGAQDGSQETNEVFLVFPEVVEGFYKVISWSDATTVVTYENPFERHIASDNADQIVNNLVAAPGTGSNPAGGATPGTQYTVKVRPPGSSELFLQDGDTVVIEISVRNILGVTLDDRLTLTVN
jgi:hypothetical protein